MEIGRGEALALAQQSCTFCLGLGVCSGRAGVTRACNCVLRSIFRACYSRFRQCATKEKYISRASLERSSGPTGTATCFGMKNEEFMADFVLIARRVLDDAHYALFKFHFLLGADWKLCCRKLGLDRGAFFHDVYRVQQILGRAYASVAPHSLFPVDEYFGGSAAGARSKRVTSARQEALNHFVDVEIPGVTDRKKAGRPRTALSLFPMKKAA